MTRQAANILQFCALKYDWRKTVSLNVGHVAQEFREVRENVNVYFFPFFRDSFQDRELITKSKKRGGERDPVR